MSSSLFRTLRVTNKLSHSIKQTKITIKLRSVRPSLLDPRFKGDACIVDQGNGLLALRLGDYSLTEFLGLPLDLPSLNQRLDQLWSHRQRLRPSKQ